MSPEKEVNYFSGFYDKGIEWYRGFFRTCEGRKVVGEISPRYLSDHRVPERIRSLIPDAKLIVSLRNPLEQIFSRYCYMVVRQMQSGSFEDILERSPFLIEEAYYYKHITRFLEYFPREQMLVLVYDDLLKDPAAFLTRVHGFLGVDTGALPENINERIHPTREPKSRLLEATVVLTRATLRKMRLFSLINLVKATGLDKRIKRLNTNNRGGFGTIGAETRKRLNDIFAEDKRMLSGLIGRDLTFWS